MVSYLYTIVFLAERDLYNTKDDNTILSMKKSVNVPHPSIHTSDSILVKITFEDNLKSERQGQMIYELIREHLPPQFGSNTVR